MKQIGAPSSGSVRADTFSRNQYGSYIRNRTIPVNPNSPAQTVVRGRFTQLSQYWRDELTPGKRILWSDYAEAHPTINKLGEAIILSGQAMFIGLNGRLLAAGGSIAENPPGLPNFVFTNFAVVATVDDVGPTIVLTVSGVDGTPGYRAMIFGSPPMSPSRVTPTRWKLIGVTSTNAWSTPVSFLSPYQLLFGPLQFQAGKNIVLEARIIGLGGELGQQLKVVAPLVDITV